MPILEQVLAQNAKKVKIVFKNFPLRSHQYAAKAALAAQSRGKFWQFHDRLFKDYQQIDAPKILEIARELGFNVAEFEKQMSDVKIMSRIRQDIEDGTRAGIRGTPNVFINGRRLRDRTLSGFQILIDKELDKIKN